MNNRLRPDDVIIRRPDRLRLPHHVTGATLTVFFWGLMLWMLQPALTLAAWYLNIGNIGEKMATEEGWQAFMALLWVYGITITVMCSSLLIWARVQQWRFRGKEKRNWPLELSNQQVAQWFGADPFARRHWMRLRHSNAYFDEATQSLTIRPRSPEGEEISMDYVYTSPVRELSAKPDQQHHCDSETDRLERTQ